MFFHARGCVFLLARCCNFSRGVFSWKVLCLFLPRFLSFFRCQEGCVFFLDKGLRFFFFKDSVLFLPSDCGCSCQGVVISSQRGCVFFRAERLCFFRANGSSLFLAKVLCLCLARGCVFFAARGCVFLVVRSCFFLQGVFFARGCFFAKGCFFLQKVVVF